MNEDDDLPPSAMEELDDMAQENRKQPENDTDVTVEIFDGVRGQDGSPVDPVRLQAEDSFCFRCHKDVPCWNECCHGADITLTPMDILRLARHFDITSREVLERYTVPAMWDKADLPVAKLKMSGADGKGACHFMTDDGCSVYENRPATCRYYPLGLASVKMKGADDKDEFFFLVKETHCSGHKETKEQTVAGFREEQGLEAYDDVNRGWMDILMKMASWNVLGGPWGQRLTPQTQKMFFMVSTDVDSLRRFVFETKFLETYEIDPEAVEVLREDDEILMKLGFDWMKNILFNEPTIGMKENVLQASISKARNEMGAT
ncbi:MAG: YkgJ family cysteine cluster protein [Rhodospirillales bacterium]|nr:YkgJ family cysteine cluster protein [Rhodospirillales bacterium]MCW8861698.1 YkgJ family cysteine cluster protein [Rhodospirillales bacterium]MCW8951482.1 YkgJ family cysteine cluster protein [Rhodospirillales bacterium]MCW8970463.1 YkgJ family cysteine cluster protein [Rhodospirillales bacterium]MCW9002968.1 YkgJ family cysteine cluster protein [Rhodospirillales bacterium]